MVKYLHVQFNRMQIIFNPPLHLLTPTTLEHIKRARRAQWPNNQKIVVNIQFRENTQRQLTGKVKTTTGA